jgi:alkylation response protein AidB-like acyl-CoA dehydrogenase
VLIVYAKLDDGRGEVLAALPGLTPGKPLKKMGMMSSPTGELFFDNVRITGDRLLGETERRAGQPGPISSPNARAWR